MRQLSVMVSDHLHQQIVEEGRQIGVDNVSDAVRILLLLAIENKDLIQNGREGKAIRNEVINHSFLDHYLLEECLLSFFEDGVAVKERAYEKAEKRRLLLSQENSES